MADVTVEHAESAEAWMLSRFKEMILRLRLIDAELDATESKGGRNLHARLLAAQRAVFIIQSVYRADASFGFGINGEQAQAPRSLSILFLALHNVLHGHAEPLFDPKLEGEDYAKVQSDIVKAYTVAALKTLIAEGASQREASASVAEILKKQPPSFPIPPLETLRRWVKEADKKSEKWVDYSDALLNEGLSASVACERLASILSMRVV